MTHLPADAAVWRAHQPGGGHTRVEVLLAALERRVTILWATVAAALGHQVADEHLAGPLDADADEHDDLHTATSMREIALMMRS